MEIARRTFLKSVALVPFAAQLFLKDPFALEDKTETVEIADYIPVYGPDSKLCLTLTGKVQGPARIKSIQSVGQGNKAYCGLMRNGRGDVLLDNVVGWSSDGQDTYQMTPSGKHPILVPEGEFIEMQYVNSYEPFTAPVIVIYFYRG